MNSLNKLKQRGNSVAALLQSFESGQTQKALYDANNADGSAMEEQNRWLESIEAKTARAQAAWQMLSSTMINSALPKFFLDLKTNGIMALDAIIKKFGMFPVLVGAITAAFTAAKDGVGFLQYSEKDGKGSLTDFITANKNRKEEQAQAVIKKSEETKIDVASLKEYEALVASGKANTDTFKEAMKNASSEAKDYAVATQGAAGSAEAFGSVQADAAKKAAKELQHLTLAQRASNLALKAGKMLTNVGVMMAVSFAVNLASKAISNYANRNKIAVEEADALSKAYKDQVDSIEDNKKTINSLKDEYQELARGVDDNGRVVSLSADQQKRYHEIVNKIVALSPSLIKGYDSEGNAIVKKNDLIQESIDLQKEQLRIAAMEQTTPENNWKVAKGEITKYNKALKETKNNSENVQQIIKDNIGLSDGSEMKFGVSDKDMSKKYVDKFIKTFNLSLKGLDFNGYSVNSDGLFDQLFTNQDNVDKIFNSLKENGVKQLSELFSDNPDKGVRDVSDALGLYFNAVVKADQASKGFNTQLQTMATARPEFDRISKNAQQFVLDDYIGTFKLSGKKGKEAEAEIEQFGDDVKNFVELLSKSPKAQMGITDLFEFKTTKDDLPVEEYIKQYEDFVDKIVDDLDLSEKEGENLKISLNLELADAKSIQKGVADRLKDLDIEDKDKKLAKLDLPSLKVFYEVLGDPDAEYTSFDDVWDAMKRQQEAAPKIKIETDLGESKTDVKEFIEGIDKINSILTSTTTGKSVSFADFSADEVMDYASALEFANGTMQVNADKAMEIAAAKAEEAKASNNIKKINLQNTYNNNLHSIKNLNRGLEDNKKLTKEQVDNANNVINSLLEENSNIADTINYYNLLNKTLDESTSAYQNYLNSKGADGPGKMYDEIYNGYKKIKEVLKEGNTGDLEYRAAVKLILGDVDPNDLEEVKRLQQKVDKYLYNPEGAKQGLQNFQKDLINAKLAFKKGDKIEFGENVSFEKISEKLEIPMELVQAMMGKFQEYGAEFNFEDLSVKSPLEKLHNVNIELEEANAEYDKLQKDRTLKVDSKELVEARERVKELEDEKIEIIVEKVELNNEWDQKINAQQALLDQLNIDKLAPKNQTPEKQQKIAIDISDAELQLEKLIKEKEGLGEPTEAEVSIVLNMKNEELADVNAKILIETDPEELEKLNKTKNELEEDIEIIGKMDTTEVESSITTLEKENEKLKAELEDPSNITVNIDGAKTGLDSLKDYHSALQDHFNRQPLIVPQIIKKVTGDDFYGPPAPGDAGALGKNNALVTGNAFAIGGMNSPTQRKIRSKYKSTLVGELGREMVVDPRSGSWYTVGDSGAEMVVLPKNALVFNHRQTEDLLGNQSTNSRASAPEGLGGLSFAMGAMGDARVKDTKVTGSMPSHFTGVRAPNTTKKKSKTAKSADKASKSLDKFKQTIDWLEVSVKRLQKRISIFEARLGNSSAVTTSMHYLKKILKELGKSLTTYNTQYKTYNKKYKKSLDKLSAEDRKKVENGATSIEDFKDNKPSKDKDKNGDGKGTNEKRYDNIQAALDWRDKAYDAKLSIEDAKAAIKDYATTLANIRWDVAEKAIEKINTAIDLLASKTTNAIGYKNQNKYIDQQKNEERKKLNTEKTALAKTKNDLKDSKSEIKKLFGDKYKDRTDKNKQISTKGLTGAELVAVETYNARILKTRELTDKVNQSTQDLTTTINDLSSTQFSNITDHYQRRKDNIDARNTKVSNSIAQNEAKGQLVGSALYEEQKRLAKQSLTYLEEERKAKKKTFDELVKKGDIKEFSPEWFDLRKDLYDTEAAIQEAETAIIDLNNSLRQLKWDNFDKLIEQFSNLIAESDFLIDLMSNRELINKEGGYTKEGVATQGQHAYNYNAYMAESEYYATEIAKINANSTDQAEIERRNQLIKARQDAIRSAEAEKKAMVDLRQQGIQAEIEAMRELTETKKKALDAEKELRDYQNNIASKTKSIVALQKQINALEGDDSLENKKKLRELKAKLSEANKDLEDTEYNKSIDTQKDVLDKSLEEFTKKMEDYSKDTDRIFTESMKLVNSESTKIANTLKDTASAVGYTISTDITAAWTKAGNSVSTYSKTFMTSSSGVLSVLAQMKTAWDAVAAAAEKAAEQSVAQMQAETKNGSDPNYSKKTAVEAILKKANGTGAGTSALNKAVTDHKYKQLSYANMEQLAKELGIKGVTAKSIVNDTAKKNEILKELKKTMGWSKGGIVERTMSSVAQRNGDIGFGTLRPGETVLTEDFTRMLPYAVKSMNALTSVANKGFVDDIKKLSTANISHLNNTQQNNNPVVIDINAPLIHCDKFDADFVKDLQRNTSYQNAILDLVMSPITDGKTHRINRNF